MKGVLETRRPVRLAQAAVVFLLATVLAYCYWSWGLARGQVPGSFPDLYFFLWNLQHQQQVVAGASPLYFSDQIFHPFGSSLFLHTQAESLGLPIALALPAAQPVSILYRAALVSAFGLNAAALYFLFVTILPCAILAGWFALLVAFHPFFVAHAEAGHLNFLLLFPFVGALLGSANILLDLRRRSKALEAFLTGTCIAVTLFSNLYYTYFLGLCIPALIALRLSIRPGGVWADLFWVGGATAMGIGLAVVKIVGVTTVALSAEYTANHDPARHAIDMLGYFVPSAFQLMGSSELVAGLRSGWVVNAAESAGYLGVGLLFLLIVRAADIRTCPRRTLVTGSLIVLLFAALSFGPAIAAQGRELISGIPYRVFAVLPFFPTVPARFSLLVILALFVAAAYGTRLGLQNGRPSFLVLLALVACTIEYLPGPPGKMPVETSPVLERLRADSEIVALHDAADEHRKMWHQTVHRKRIVGGMLARRPRRALRFYRRNAFLRFIDGRPAIANLRPSYEALGIDGVLVPRERQDVLTRLQSLDWLKIRYQDDRLMFFFGS